ncbi:unnamed protein product [Rangifer tarandus platyrhynchus]|uniref:Uncharacterized protein n=1 Tax=Rangifer tarandus platyrhynchus TaxID=3082113 RepID=A0AC59ZMJ1_RANTA
MERKGTRDWAVPSLGSDRAWRGEVRPGLVAWLFGSRASLEARGASEGGEVRLSGESLTRAEGDCRAASPERLSQLVAAMLGLPDQLLFENPRCGVPDLELAHLDGGCACFLICKIL